MDPSDTNAFFNAGYTLRTLQAARTPDWGPTRTPPHPSSGGVLPAMLAPVVREAYTWNRWVAELSVTVVGMGKPAAPALLSVPVVMRMVPFLD